MLYYANPVKAARDHMSAGRIGCIITPGQGNTIPPGAPWCADNGRFGKGWPGPLRYEAWLASYRPYAQTCAFAVAPDVPFDMAATLRLSRPWLYHIRRMGYPAALALQDDCRLPWDDFDVLFIAGSMEFKWGVIAADYTRQARARGKHVHWGRCNSLTRIRQAHGMGCDSADGGYLRYGPDKNLPRLLGWLDELDRNGAQTFI